MTERSTRVARQSPHAPISANPYRTIVSIHFLWEERANSNRLAMVYPKYSRFMPDRIQNLKQNEPKAQMYRSKQTHFKRNGHGADSAEWLRVWFLAHRHVHSLEAQPGDRARAMGLGKSPAEMRLVREAANQRDLAHWHPLLGHQSLCTFDAAVQHVLVRRHRKATPESTREMRGAQPRKSAQVRDANLELKILFDKLAHAGCLPWRKCAGARFVRHDCGTMGGGVRFHRRSVPFCRTQINSRIVRRARSELGGHPTRAPVNRCEIVRDSALHSDDAR